MYGKRYCQVSHIRHTMWMKQRVKNITTHMNSQKNRYRAIRQPLPMMTRMINILTMSRLQTKKQEEVSFRTQEAQEPSGFTRLESLFCSYWQQQS